jgi:hypothetical protein
LPSLLDDHVAGLSIWEKKERQLFVFLHRTGIIEISHSVVLNMLRRMWQSRSSDAHGLPWIVSLMMNALKIRLWDLRCVFIRFSICGRGRNEKGDWLRFPSVHDWENEGANQNSDMSRGQKSLQLLYAFSKSVKTPGAPLLAREHHMTCTDDGP